MASFTDTFERKEVKYRLNAKQHREVLDALAGRMAADEYGRTRITSLYFDTPTRDLIARSLEKPLYKEKLRLRWYGTPTSGERVYVEIKKKYDGIVYERTAYAPVPGADADGLRITFDSGVAYRDVLAGRARGGQHLPSAFGPGRDDHGGEDRRCLPVLAGRGARRMPGVSVVVQQVRRRLPGVRTCRRRPFRSRCLPIPDLPKG